MAALVRAPDKGRILISIMLFSSPNPMFDHLLESSHRDDSIKWSNIGIGEEITKTASIEVHFTHIIWSSGLSAHIMQHVKIVDSSHGTFCDTIVLQ